MVETVELVCKRVHTPWPNVRIPANTRIALGPPELVDALVARGFFERVAPEILTQEADIEPPTEEQPKGRRGK